MGWYKQDKPSSKQFEMVHQRKVNQLQYIL